MKVLREMNELQQFDNDVWSPGKGGFGGNEKGIETIFPSGKPSMNG
jgi:hypothetical protein